MLNYTESMLKTLDDLELSNLEDEYTRNKVLHKMTTERDLKNQFAYARKEGFAVGREEGREEGRAEVAKRMLAHGMEIEQIAEITQLSIDKIKSLQ